MLVMENASELWYYSAFLDRLTMVPKWNCTLNDTTAGDKE
jgi:hypothetical protein